MSGKGAGSRVPFATGQPGAVVDRRLVPVRPAEEGRRSAVVIVAATLATLAALASSSCNAVFGIDDLVYGTGGAGVGGAATTSTGTAAGGGCVEATCTTTSTGTGTGTATTTGTGTGTCTGALCNGSCCGLGQVCDAAGSCCAPDPSPCTGESPCGERDDGCGNTVDCGTCGTGQYCLDRQSCTSLSLLFRPIAAGAFNMGSPVNEPGRDDYLGPYGELDETSHSVTLTSSFELAESEVTQEDFALVMGYHPSFFTACGSSCPVEELTWDEAAAFCNRLSELKRLTPCFLCQGAGAGVSCQLSDAAASPYDCPGYRLPTEAEWEYAARAGTSSAYSSGGLSQTACNLLDASLNAIGWYITNGSVGYPGSVDIDCDGNAVPIGTHPVGLRAENAFGLHDMAGNVWEWVLDCPASYLGGPATNPFEVGPCANSDRIYRGGGVGNLAVYSRHAERASYTPGGHMKDIGFRPARTLP